MGAKKGGCPSTCLLCDGNGKASVTPERCMSRVGWCLVLGTWCTAVGISIVWAMAALPMNRACALLVSALPGGYRSLALLGYRGVRAMGSGSHRRDDPRCVSCRYRTAVDQGPLALGPWNPSRFLLLSTFRMLTHQTHRGPDEVTRCRISGGLRRA